MARTSKTKRPIVGLDIQPGTVSAAMVSIDGRLAVTQSGTVSLAPNVVRDGEVADIETLTEALKELFREHKLDKRVRIGVANQRIVVRTLDLPPTSSAKELEAVVRFHAQDELPMRLDEAVIDFHSVGTIETPEGPRQRVVLVAARRTLIENVVAAARGAGLRPEGVDLSAFAMVRALYDGIPTPTLYLSIGGLTNLAIAEGSNVLFTRASGSALEGMAGLLAERRGLAVEDARRQLATVGIEGPVEPGTEEEAGLARAVLSEGIRRIAGEARASLDFHHAANPAGAPVERAVVTGPVVGVPGFVDALAEELGLPVVSGSVGGGLGEAEGARYAIAAGLAVEEIAA